MVTLLYDYLETASKNGSEMFSVTFRTDVFLQSERKNSEEGPLSETFSTIFINSLFTLHLFTLPYDRQLVMNERMKYSDHRG